jgi:hypothetical protein
MTPAAFVFLTSRSRECRHGSAASVEMRAVVTTGPTTFRSCRLVGSNSPHHSLSQVQVECCQIGAPTLDYRPPFKYYTNNTP